MTKTKPVTVKRGYAYVSVSYDVLRDLLKLPEGVKLKSAIQYPIDVGDEQIRFYLEGEGLPECEVGKAVPQVLIQHTTETKFVRVQFIEPEKS